MHPGQGLPREASLSPPHPPRKGLSSRIGLELSMAPPQTLLGVLAVLFTTDGILEA